MNKIPFNALPIQGTQFYSEFQSWLFDMVTLTWPSERVQTSLLLFQSDVWHLQYFQNKLPFDIYYLLFKVTCDINSNFFYFHYFLNKLPSNIYYHCSEWLIIITVINYWYLQYLLNNLSFDINFCSLNIKY